MSYGDGDILFLVQIPLALPAGSAPKIICFLVGSISCKPVVDKVASVAQLDACQNGDQEVAESATIFSGDLIMKYFLQSFSPIC